MGYLDVLANRASEKRAYNEQRRRDRSERNSELTSMLSGLALDYGKRKQAQDNWEVEQGLAQDKFGLDQAKFDDTQAQFAVSMTELEEKLKRDYAVGFDAAIKENWDDEKRSAHPEAYMQWQKFWQQQEANDAQAGYYSRMGRDGDDYIDLPALASRFAGEVSGELWDQLGEGFASPYVDPALRDKLIANFKRKMALSDRFGEEGSADWNTALAYLEDILAGKIDPPDPFVPGGLSGGTSGAGGGSTWGDEKEPGLLSRLMDPIKDKLGGVMDPELSEIPSITGDPREALANKAMSAVTSAPPTSEQVAGDSPSGFSLPATGTGSEAVESAFAAYQPADAVIQAKVDRVRSLLPILDAIALTPSQGQELAEKIQAATDGDNDNADLQGLERFIKGLR